MLNSTLLPEPRPFARECILSVHRKLICLGAPAVSPYSLLCRSAAFTKPFTLEAGPPPLPAKLIKTLETFIARFQCLSPCAAGSPRHGILHSLKTSLFLAFVPSYFHVVTGCRY